MTGILFLNACFTINASALLGLKPRETLSSTACSKYLQSIDSDAFVIRWKDVSYISLPMVCVLCGVAYPAVIVGSLLGLTVLLGCKWTTTVNSKCLQPILFTPFAMDHVSVDPSERSMENIVSNKCVSGFDCTI